MFGKKKFQKNITHSNEFFKSYEIKINALIRLAEGSETAVSSLKKLQEDFRYTVAIPDADAKKYEKQIDKMYEQLRGLLLQASWNEQDVSMAVKSIQLALDELNAIRNT